MKTINKLTCTQLREMASLRVNNTDFCQPSELFFVQLDNDHSVDNTGAIFQIVDEDSADDVVINPNALQYQGQSGVIYNYAEDGADFEEDTEDFDIYCHCFQQATLCFDENI